VDSHADYFHIIVSSVSLAGKSGRWSYGWQCDASRVCNKNRTREGNNQPEAKSEKVMKSF
jgi:hypothetical protein